MSLRLQRFQTTLALLLLVGVGRNWFEYYNGLIAIFLLLFSVGVAGALAINSLQSLWKRLWGGKDVVCHIPTEATVRTMHYCAAASIFAAFGVLRINECLWLLPLLCVLEVRKERANEALVGWYESYDRWQEQRQPAYQTPQERLWEKAREEDMAAVCAR